MNVFKFASCGNSMLGSHRTKQPTRIGSSMAMIPQPQPSTTFDPVSGYILSCSYVFSVSNSRVDVLGQAFWSPMKSATSLLRYRVHPSKAGVNTVPRRLTLIGTQDLKTFVVIDMAVNPGDLDSFERQVNNPLVFLHYCLVVNSVWPSHSQSPGVLKSQEIEWVVTSDISCLPTGMPIRMDPPSPTPSPTPTPTPSPSPSPDPGDAPLIDLDPLMPLFPARAHLAYGSTSSHSLICTPSGELFAWGSNDSGQLGDSSQSDAHIPVIVSIFGSLIGTRVAQAAVGAHHSLALDARGKVHAWGRISVEEDHAVPHLVSMSGSLVDRECVQVSAGGSHSLVLDTQGQVHVWGSNCFGQLGVSSTVDSSVPSAVYSEGCLAGRRISQVSAGFFHSLALDCSGQVHAWGNNAQGQLGSSIDITHSDVPLAIVSGSLEGKCVTRISAGGSFSLALDSSGILHAWGYNHSGQLGIGSTAPSRVPTAIGYNHNGQVGTPLFGSLLYKTVTDMVASGAHSLALDSDGGIHAWGLNTYGQLGDDSTSQAASPVEITGAGSLSRHATPIQLSGGGLHSLALDACGNIHTWGMNANGQLGSSEVSLRFSDVPISVATCGSNGLITDLISPILHVPCHVSR